MTLSPVFRKSLFFFLSLGHFANDLAPCSVVILAPAVALEMGLSPLEVGLLISLHSIGGASGYFPAGLLADSSRDRGRLLMLTFWWVGAGYLLASMAPGFWSLALLFALAGFGDAAWHPLATTILVQNAPSRRAQAIGIHAFGGTMAAVIGPVIVGILLSRLDWRESLQCIAFPALLAGLLFLKIRRWVPVQPSRLFWSKLEFVPLLRLWSRKRGIVIIGLMGSYNMALVALMSMIPLYLQDYHGLSSVQTGFAFGVMVLVGAVLQPLIGRLSDAVGRRQVIIFGTLVSTLCSASVPFFEEWGFLGFILAVLVAGVAMLECIRSTVLASAVEYTGTREGTTLGFAFFLMDGVGAMGALLAGWAAGINFSHVFLLASVLSATALLLGLFVSLRPQDFPQCPE